MSETVRLTSYSHGAGCGCKIAPAVLSEILAGHHPGFPDARLLVGNTTRDDAAVYAIDEDRAVVSTTDFFMPIVDDPGDFGGIAAVNAISDIYAMGGTPLMAIAILGWPVNKLSTKIASAVLDGAREACARARIPLAGGHSIDAPEPIFGLAVTGLVDRKNIKANNAAVAGCNLYLTKPLGIGIVSTAQKRGVVSEEDFLLARDVMLELNDIGSELADLDGVKAMTDVTGFGLLGHLIELCEGSSLSATVQVDALPLISCVNKYLEIGTVPGGTSRNFESYGHKVGPMSDYQKTLLCDPQTSGGLLVAVAPGGEEEFLACTASRGLSLQPFGTLEEAREDVVKLV
ncbi:MAG: selenide, water dikinase SelD [Myxococcales bacterium]|nr:selenide, water dikinase SelD [Myxococcales bacterium]|tara:strand:- start:408 stop:1442 length:1035 start_codon:yes stop_codon:yes gene_type:complete